MSNALEQALTAPDAPELAHIVLNLAEFLEHCEGGALPISTHLLGERAMHCRAYAKALHYKVTIPNMFIVQTKSISLNSLNVHPYYYSPFGPDQKSPKDKLNFLSSLKSIVSAFPMINLS